MIPSTKYSEERHLDGIYQSLTTYIPRYLGIPQTLQCNLITPKGEAYTLRALMDPGSQVTAILKSTAAKLSLKGPKRTLIVGTSGAKELTFYNQIAVEFKLSSIKDGYITPFNIEAVTIPKITCDLTPINIDPLKHEHLKDIQFTEELPMTNQTPKRVELLIGEPYTSQLLEKIISGNSLDEPKAAVFQIGACLTGAAPPTGEERIKILTTLEVPKKELPPDIQEFFNLENIGIENPMELSQLTEEEQKAEDMMKANTYYDQEQKCWHTKLLWTDGPIRYTNEKRASSTATRIIKRFSKPENKDAWESIQKVYESNYKLGITELVPRKDLMKKNEFHYIPMSMVFKPESATTPVRPVFNANQEMGVEKTSFNKKLLEGPNLLPQLQKLIIQFRYYPKIALLDISKLYSRIRVSKEDAERQRFFWTEEKMEPGQEKAKLKSYRQNRLIFGSKSSPYQAQYILKRHSEMFNNFYLANFTYLDDIFVGNHDSKTVTQDLKQLIWVLKQGDFPAQKIVSNDEKILEDLDESVRGPKEITKVYGQTWNLKEDKLTFIFKKEKSVLMNKEFTKRECLSQMMSLYDLSGLIQPYHLKAKLIFQKTCELKLDWDEKLPQSLQEEFQKWMNELPELDKVTVNRCFLPSKEGKICFIASFSDSSNVGLGVNTYIISEDKDGTRKSELAFCKAKVLPLKQKYTTPRSELAAAQLNARAANYVAEALTTVVGDKPKIYYFSDSEITLYRLQKPAETYQVWVANRIRAIQKQTEVKDWHKVNTAENPADISSRGAYLTEFVDSDLFFHGPKWLTDPNTQFKRVGETLTEELQTLDKEEVRKILLMNILNVSTSKDEDDIIKNILDRHNNWKKTVKILSWCRRFCTIIKQKVIENKGKRTTRQSQRKTSKNNAMARAKTTFDYKNYYLHPTEVTETENILFQYAQRCEFATEIALLSEGSEIPKDSKIKTLIPIWDKKEELLRHNSRIMNYQPIILPKDHHVTKLFIQNVHTKFGHSGPSLTLYKVRQRVWIISGRQQIKKALLKCSCRQSILLNERMGKIPLWRTEKPSIWTRVGTDVFGPLYVKQEVVKEDVNGDEIKTTKIVKTFAVLWTDLISRGVMVDLLYSADTEGILKSLRKLTAIYGSAQIYYSDNASYYTKASKELKNFITSIDWSQLQKEAQKWNAEWIFATAASPFRNATSERLISSIKQALATTIKKSALSFPELATCLLEISSYINNRPLGFLTSDNQDDMQPISPSLLTIGREIEVLGDYQGKDPDLKELYNHRKETLQGFLKNWTALYLQNLSPTQKWLTRNPYKIKPGMVLFIKDENKMKDLWKKGIVTKVIYSKNDNIPRTVELRTATAKKIIRPIQKLAIPEYEIVDEDGGQVTSHCILLQPSKIE